MASYGRAGPRGSQNRPVCIDLDDHRQPMPAQPIDLTQHDRKRQRPVEQRPRAADPSDSLRQQLASAQAQWISVQKQLATSIARESAAREAERAAREAERAAREAERAAKAEASHLDGQLAGARASIHERNLRLLAMAERQREADVQKREAEVDPQPFLRALEAQRLSVGRRIGALRAHAERHDLTRSVLATGGTVGACDRRVLSAAPGSCWREDDGEMGSVWHLRLNRKSLGSDLLRELDRLETPSHLFSSPRVTFEGEPGVDDRGLTRNLFAKAFGALRQVQLPTESGETAIGASRLFEVFPSGLNLPTRDPPGGEPSARAQRQRPGATPPLSSLRAWGLIGRLLAWQLRQPQGLYVDDRLPRFALEWLATGEAASLRTADGALAALRQMHGADGGVLTYCEKCLATPVVELAGALHHQPTLSDLLPHGYWRICKPGAAADECACGKTALSDEGKEAAFLAAIQYAYVDSRLAHLRALKEGFDACEGGSVPDLDPVLQLTPPIALAVRLRGEPVRDGPALFAGIDVLRQEADDDGARWRKATVEEHQRVHGWLRDYVCALSAPATRLLLHFITGAEALAPGGGRRPSVLVYNDWDNPCSSNAFLPTASACAQQLYLPVYPSRDVFRRKLADALDDFRCQELMGPGGAAFAYS
jgi:hypothetical protein